MLQGSWLKQAGLAMTVVTILFAALAAVTISNFSLHGDTKWRVTGFVGRTDPLAFVVCGGPGLSFAFFSSCGSAFTYLADLRGRRDRL